MWGLCDGSVLVSGEGTAGHWWLQTQLCHGGLGLSHQALIYWARHRFVQKCPLLRSIIWSDTSQLLTACFHFRAILSGICDRTPSGIRVSLRTETKTLQTEFDFVVYIYHGKWMSAWQNPIKCRVTCFENIHQEPTDCGNWRLKESVMAERMLRRGLTTLRSRVS